MLGKNENTVTMSDIQKTVTVSSALISACAECHESIGDGDDDAQVDVMINHYLDHGYRLLHVGQQTEMDDSGELWHITVAVLGKP